MPSPHSKIVTLTSCASEIEAASIVALLADNGIHAEASGVYTSGMRAEAPGEVKILVVEDNLEEARRILAESHENALDDDGNGDDDS